jgi:hypothetical protein
MSKLGRSIVTSGTLRGGSCGAALTLVGAVWYVATVDPAPTLEGAADEVGPKTSLLPLLERSVLRREGVSELARLRAKPGCGMGETASLADALGLGMPDDGPAEGAEVDGRPEMLLTVLERERQARPPFALRAYVKLEPEAET